MKPIEGRRPVHKEIDTDQPNQKEEDEELNGQEDEEKTNEKKGKGISSKPISHTRLNQENSLLKLSWIIGLLAITVGCAALAWKFLSTKEEGVPGIAKNRETTDESKLSEELETLENTYTEQDVGTWISLASGIKSVVREKPNKPSVFLMLYDTDSAGKTAKCIAVDVSKKATKYLVRRAESPVIISPNELGDQRYLQDPGLVLTEYNHTIRERGALIVPNLQEVPPKVAEIFHFICDRYSPLVETAVMFFTLKVEKSPKTIIKLQEVATRTLEKLWSKSMKDNTLHPLITRMTPNIVNINSDSANC